MEEWKDIIEPTGYQVSNFGRIRSIDRCVTHKNGKRYFLKGVLLKCFLDKDGYVKVKLRSNNKQNTYSVHRLVCRYYKDNWDSSLEVNHLDFNRANNHISNLQMCTHMDNMLHSVNNGRFRFNPIPFSTIQQIRDLKGYIGQRQLAKLYSVARSTVSDIHNNKTRVYY